MNMCIPKRLTLSAIGHPLLIGSLLATNTGLLQAAPFVLTTLGNLGGITTTATGLNDSGQVVGFSQTSSGARHAFISAANGGSLIDLGTLGGTNSTAYGVNNSGRVVGSAYTTGDATQHAFISAVNGGSLNDLGTLGGGNSIAYGINSSGRVVGSSTTSANLHAFISAPNGGSLTDLGTLGGNSSDAYGVNNSGQVVGFFSSASTQHAFISAANGGSLTDLGTLGGDFSFAYGVNNSGQVVGDASTGVYRHAFIRAANGGSLIDLGTFGGIYSGANGINNSGQVVGHAYTTGNAAQHAFLYTGSIMVDLATLTGNNTLSDAKAINDFGQIAVNSGSAAFLLTLNPSWTNTGNSNWDSASNWEFGGTGVLNGLTPGAPHDVTINPNGSATVYGSANAKVHNLSVTGNTGELVTLNLNGGSTATIAGTTLSNATLAGSGRLAGDLTVSSDARVNIGAGETMQFSGGFVYNFGTLSAMGTAANFANLQASSWVENLGKINLQQANVAFLGSLYNVGQLNVTFGTANVFGNITNTSFGKIILSGNSQTTFWDTVDVTAGSELRVATGSSGVFFGDVHLRNGAILSGLGSKSYEGLLDIGNSPGFSSDEGNVDLGAGALYNAELGGLSAGSEFDKYVVAGKLSFGGTLKLMWYGNFSAQAGDVFDLFDWGSSDGSFSSIDTNLAQLGNGLNWDFSKLYSTGEIGVAAVPLPPSWLMLLSGLGVTGWFGRRRKPSQTPSFDDC